MTRGNEKETCKYGGMKGGKRGEEKKQMNDLFSDVVFMPVQNGPCP